MFSVRMRSHQLEMPPQLLGGTWPSPMIVLLAHRLRGGAADADLMDGWGAGVAMRQATVMSVLANWPPLKSGASPWARARA
jgi:hypothetical protein